MVEASACGGSDGHDNGGVDWCWWFQAVDSAATLYRSFGLRGCLAAHALAKATVQEGAWDCLIGINPRV